MKYLLKSSKLLQFLNIKFSQNFGNSFLNNNLLLCKDMARSTIPTKYYRLYIQLWELIKNNILLTLILFNWHLNEKKKKNFYFCFCSVRHCPPSPALKLLLFLFTKYVFKWVWLIVLLLTVCFVFVLVSQLTFVIHSILF